jgi:hypothetical protein
MYAHQAYRDSRHHVLYEDGQEDIGIIDGRKLWLLEDDKWTSLRLRWKDEDLHLVADQPTLDKSEPEAAGDKKGDGKAAAQLEEKADAQNKDGWQAPSENVGGFMIGCDNCGTHAPAAALCASSRAHAYVPTRRRRQMVLWRPR